MAASEVLSDSAEEESVQWEVGKNTAVYNAENAGTCS